MRLLYFVCMAVGYTTSQPYHDQAPPPESSQSNLTAQLCSACEAVWLDATRQENPAVGGVPANACFFLINSTCSDCRRDATRTCSQAYYLADPQPVSGLYSFCAGHAATAIHEMSYVAWMRVIDWRATKCPSLRQRSAWEALDRNAYLRPDVHWLKYYEVGDSHWG